ncbi:MAG: adenine-specific methyltransferase EcoRI family protein [Alphaproteobacteria bacterium]|nr:adenine-specific methyltransferase EcoRI family protein [Alphaproteobacteria bacterium]
MSARAAQNRNLGRARAAQNDEFYTQLADIERELAHYAHHFRGRTVFCNCDDPRVSKFFDYFSRNFEFLKLRKLVTTCYQNPRADIFSRHDSEKAVRLEYNGDLNNNRMPDPDEIGVQDLREDGDFRSEECVELLRKADIVVTNPPFSLFREFVAQLVAHKKKFLVIGNHNALTYKEIFKLIKANKVWLGYSPRGMEFLRPDGSLNSVNACWFTNLDHAKRHEDLVLYEEYSPKAYLKYDNYDAINVDKTAKIPADYAGVMGVPISFLDKYNPDQFKIIGLAAGNIRGLAGIPTTSGTDGPYINGKLKYGRIFIRNKRVQK